MKIFNLKLILFLGFIALTSNASPPQVFPSSGRLIIDNDASFLSKIEAIRQALPHETIRLIYFIYANDESSSVFSQELLAAAQRGVKIELLVDLLTNYKNLDLFDFLQKKSNGKIEVRFFGRPSSKIIRDLIFMTKPCPHPQEQNSYKFCSDEKWKYLSPKEADFFSQLLLSGLFGKNPLAIKTSILMGQMIHPEDYKNGAGSADENEQLKIFFKLLYQAQFKKDLVAALKVRMAMVLHSEQIIPLLNEIYGRIPLDQMGDNSLQDWMHFSDYTHHKLLMVGNHFVQIGGRNIENSYHMKANELTDKYIFMDTDIAFKLRSGAEQIQKTFYDLWDFKDRVISLDQVQALMPNDFITNSEAFNNALKKCTPLAPYNTLGERNHFETCLRTEITLQPQFQSRSQRLDSIKSDLQSKAQKYWQKYYPNLKINETWKNSNLYDDSIPEEQLQDMLITYIENVPFDQNASVKKRSRIYGSVYGQELTTGKDLHHHWQKGLEKACSSLKPNRVILHSAYLLPPSGIMRTFSKMMDGTWDCRHVRVTILTNSIATTDLNIINVLARYQMLALFQIFSQRKQIFGPSSEKRSAQFELYEYLPEKNSTEDLKSYSLHSKVSLLGDDLLIGSANADVRSYYMDTNNGFYLKNAPALAKDYSQWVDSLLNNSQKTKNISEEMILKNEQIEHLFAQDELLIEHLLLRYGFSQRLSPETKKQLKNYAQKIGFYIYDTSRKTLSDDFIETYGQGYLESQETQRKEQLELMEEFDRWLMLF